MTVMVTLKKLKMAMVITLIHVSFRVVKSKIYHSKSGDEWDGDVVELAT